MSRSICHIANDADEGKRLDVVLYENAIYPSRSSAQQAISSNDVLVNGQKRHKNYSVSNGDNIICTLKDEPGSEVIGEDIDLDIRYFDDDLIVLSKQPGLLTHPTQEYRESTLVNALIHRFGRDGLCNVQGDHDRLGIVHRLDADTSGLMLAARNDVAGEILMEDIRSKSIDRRYIALVHGIISADTGMIDAPIARNPSNRKAMAVIDSDRSRDAITTFKVLQRFEQGKDDNGYTLVECKLFTGRTHQIRLHMQYIRHPVVGDPLYVKHKPRSGSADFGLNRQFLHSYRLSLDHPTKNFEMSFQDNLEQDLIDVLNRLNTRDSTITDYGEEIDVVEQTSCNISDKFDTSVGN